MTQPLSTALLAKYFLLLAKYLLLLAKYFQWLSHPVLLQGHRYRGHAARLRLQCPLSRLSQGGGLWLGWVVIQRLLDYFQLFQSPTNAQWESVVVMGCHKNEHFSNNFTIWKNLVLSIFLQKLNWFSFSKKYLKYLTLTHLLDTHLTFFLQY